VILQSVFKRQRQIAGKSRQKLRVLTAKTPRLLDGSSPNLDMMYPDYLARSANLPEGLYILLMFFRYFFYLFF